VTKNLSGIETESLYCHFNAS